MNNHLIMINNNYKELSSYASSIERIKQNWPQFIFKRAERLKHGGESEKVAENIIDDLFTEVLDWEKGDLKFQKGYSDIILSKHSRKYLIIEVKRPGTFRTRRDLEGPVAQARRYAEQQSVNQIAASDGRYLYVADICNGGLIDRLLIDLSNETPPCEALWWVSEHGIYRSCPGPIISAFILSNSDNSTCKLDDGLLHPKYKLPASCFAYVGDVNDFKTWKLPYKMICGSIDSKRLPKAIQALLSNFRGTKVGGIPEQSIPNVLKRLGEAALIEGRIPSQGLKVSPVYKNLELALKQNSIDLVY